MFDRRRAIMLLSTVIYPPISAKARKMKIGFHQPQQTSYAQATHITGASRWLFVSGQVPADDNAVVPTDFEDQARLAWKNIVTQLARAQMSIENLVKVTIFLSDRCYREQNTKVRHAILDGHCPALTVIIATIFDPAWLIEIEAVAVA